MKLAGSDVKEMKSGGSDSKEIKNAGAEIPIREWLFGKESAQYIGVEQDHSKIELRSGGNGEEEEKKPGQVPKTRQGRAKDVAALNDYIEEARQLGVRRGLLKSSFRVSRPITVDDILKGREIQEFSLAPDVSGVYPDRRALLPMPHLADRDLFHSAKLRQTRQDEYDAALALKNRTNTCTLIGNRQSHRKMRLTFANLLTLFPERWLDSVVLDAYLHVLQEHWPLKDLLYLNSAEQDPNFKELKSTPRCYQYVTSVLYLQFHWTVIMIDHVKKLIRYLNSQVVDQRTPNKQSKPFKELFPEYTLKNHSDAQQCNQSDCGVYSAAWAMMCMYYEDADMATIRCPEMKLYRHTMLLQLILSMYLIPLQQHGGVEQ
jgi:hypothetical protein